MNYFLLNHSIDLKVVGKFPQLDKMYDGFHMSRLNEIWEKARAHTGPTPLQVSGFQVKYHAKMTDWISAVIFGSFESALISERLYNIFKEYSIMDHLLVDSEVDHHSKTYPYKYIHYTQDEYSRFVDFKRSRFYLSQNGWVGDLSFENYEDYSAMKAGLNKENEIVRLRGEISKTKQIRALELYLDESRINLDFFRITGVMLKLVVSARLKERIEAEGITGIRFEPAQGHKEPTMDYTVDPPRVVE